MLGCENAVIESRMTTQQLYLFNGLYLLVLVVVALCTRATARRIARALVYLEQADRQRRDSVAVKAMVARA